MKDLLKHFSGWFQDLQISSEKYYLVLTDDFDSFYSCRFLRKKFGIEIGGFYQFGKGLYLTSNALNSGKEPVYIDCSVCQDGTLCFDNHRNAIVNHTMINPNLITDRCDNRTYNKKYNGSTLMLLVALYGCEELTELEKQFVCAIDGFYIGWYKDDGKYRNVNKYWLEQLGLSEMLEPVLNNHNAQFFADLIQKYQLNEKIYVSDNRLFTFADILPHDRFTLAMPTKTKHLTKDELMNMSLADSKGIFTCAETYNCSYIADFLKK